MKHVGTRRVCMRKMSMGEVSNREGVSSLLVSASASGPYMPVTALRAAHEIAKRDDIV